MPTGNVKEGLWNRGLLEAARLGSRRDELLEYDERPRLHDVKKRFYHINNVDLAHVLMLTEQGVLTSEQGRLLLNELLYMRELGPERFPWQSDSGSAVVHVESYLTERLGADLAGRLHTGRSRNDQLAAIDRLFTRDHLLKIYGSALTVLNALLDKAGDHVDTLMPFYTHMQHAQPGTFGHYLMRFGYALERDLQRLRAAYDRCNMSALGGAAGAGTSWPIDRQRVASLLGHTGVVVNSTDAGAFTRDYVEENVSVLAIYMQSLGRLATDLYVWSSFEFNMVEIDDGLCGTSSIMPQKKNPHALERVKATAGQAAGWPAAVLGTQRSPMSTDLDLIFARDIVTGMYEDVWACSELMRAALETLQVSEERMRWLASQYWSTTSHLADELVRRLNISFRLAHQVVGAFVRKAIEANHTPHDAPLSLLNQMCEEAIGASTGLSEAELRDILDAKGFVKSRVSAGGVQRESVLAQIEDVRVRLAEHVAWHAEAAARARNSIDALQRQVLAFVHGAPHRS